MTGEYAGVLREMLAVTRKMHAKVDELRDHSVEEGLPVLVELEELLATRQDLINHLETLGYPSLFQSPADSDQILAEIRNLNEKIGKELDAKRQALAVSLRKVREGKKALGLVREFSARKGELLDRRK